MRHLVTLLILSCLAACEGRIPVSAVDGPLVPATAELSLSDLKIPTGTLSGNTAGRNLPVSAENIGEVADELIVVFTVIMIQATLVDSIPEISSSGEIAVDRDGLVLSGNYTNEAYGTGYYTFSSLFTAALHDWTESDGQYFGGGLACNMTFHDILGADDASGIEANIDGKLNLGGKFRGVITLRDFYVQWGAWVIHCAGEIVVTADSSGTRYHLEKDCFGCDWSIEPL